MLSVATFNIHGATRHHQGLSGFLLELDVDVLCLQECPEDTALALKAALGSPWEAAWAAAGHLGNGLLTRLPIRDVDLIHLSATFSEERSAVVADLDCGDRTVRVCCTHLDHISAESRQEQWASLLEQADLEAAVICGDLNALTRSDYSDEAWEEIAAVREQSAWEPPVSALMDELEDSGFVDAATGHDIQGTSRFGTRIDYVLLGPGCPLSGADLYTLESDGVSDHSVVIAVLE